MPGRIPQLRPQRARNLAPVRRRERPQAEAIESRRRAYETAEQRMEDKRFYASAPWRRLRRVVLSEQPLCGPCRRKGFVVAGAHVHHIKDRKERPDLALDRDNLEALCQPCHNAKRGERPDLMPPPGTPPRPSWGPSRVR